MSPLSLVRSLVLTIAALALPSASSGGDPLSTWHLRYAGEPGGPNVRTVAFGNGAFVAPLPGITQTVLRSSDGISWIRHIPSSQNFALDSGQFVNGLFFFGYGVSHDGLVWSNGCFSIPPVSDGNLFLSASEPFVVLSTNGMGCEAIYFSNFYFNGVASGFGLFVAAGYEVTPSGNHSFIATSTDGRTWAFRRQVPYQVYETVQFGNGRFVVAADVGTNLISTDGINWNSVPSGIRPWRFLGGLFVGSLSGTNFTTSIDGIASATHMFGTNENVYAYEMTFGNGTFVVAVNNYAANRAEIWQSDPIPASPSPAPVLAVAPYPGLTITGVPGARYRIEYKDALAMNGAWNLLTNIALPSTPWLYFDRDGFRSPRRFYRAVGE